MVLAVLACEDLPLSATVNRGLSLASNNLGHTLTFGLLLFAAISALSYPLSLPVVAFTIVDSIQQELGSGSISEAYKLPLYLMVINQAWESLINMLLWPAMFLAYGLLYYDLRLRQEGLDIARTLEALEGGVA